MIKTLAGSLRENKKTALLTILCSVLEVVFEIVIPLNMSNLIDYGIEPGEQNVVLRYGVLLLTFALMQLLTGVLSARWGAAASVGYAANLRKDMYENVQTFAFSNIDKFSAASIVTRLTTDVTNVQNAFQMLTRMAIRGPGDAYFCYGGRFQHQLKHFAGILCSPPDPCGSAVFNHPRRAACIPACVPHL